ncbi:MAG TPA: GDSL-type esterase/lipase family protein [Opitutaceae bacterium]
MYPPRFSFLPLRAVVRGLLIAFVVAVGCGRLPAVPERMLKAIDAYLERDRVSPPPGNAVVFVGSSSIARWKTLEQDFPGQPVVGRGLGGSTVAEWVDFIGRFVLPYKPRQVIFYAGENDIARGRTPAQVADDFSQFCRLVHEALPETRILFVSLKPSPKRWKFQPLFTEANGLIAALCAQDERLSFLDLVPAMLTPDGLPRPELFGPDHLHLSPTGYQLWTELVAPRILIAPAAIASR